MRSLRFVAAVTGLLAITSAQAQWVEFNDQSMTRVVSDPALGIQDTEEKDYAWADFDKDGDIDLAVVRKSIGSSAGKRTNVLFMNENGVLIDRTALFAASSDVTGDMGFLTPTNDRDVVAVDVDGDSWIDLVTATTLSINDFKHVGHPRVYMNLGMPQGAWLGFRYEEARIPQLFGPNSAPTNPRFCAVSAGDLTGDGFPDLYFSDYDASAAGNAEDPGVDLDDVLLVNNGSGVFADQTDLRFSGTVPSVSLPFPVSAFGASSSIADMNGDGFNDIVKQTALFSPLYVGIAYNDPAGVGLFDDYRLVNQFAPYFITTGDLNNDGKLDIVISDDGADRYYLNQGNDAQGAADFTSFTFSFENTSDDGFGSNSVISDLDNDGFNDVIVVGMDVDLPNCGFRTHFYRNLGGPPGSNVTLIEETEGTGCEASAGHPPTCEIVGIPADRLEGIHDVAVFDIDGDDFNDVVLGGCSGMQVWMNGPPIGLDFTYPQGLPFFVNPGESHQFQVQVTGFGGVDHADGTAKLFVSVSGGAFSQIAMTPLGGGLYDVTLPAASDCTDNLDFYFSAKAVGQGSPFLDPPAGNGAPYRAIAALGTAVSYEDGFEAPSPGWTTVADPTLTGGGWEIAVPVGTLGAGGAQAAPDLDAEGAVDRTHAFVTENGAPGGGPSDADVDGGPADLLSPPIDLDGADALIQYSRWFYSSGGDQLEVAVTADGSSWVTVETVAGDSNSWRNASFRVSDHVTPTANVQIRFRTSDTGNNSVTEAAIDAFRVEVFLCVPCGATPDCDDGNHCNGAEQCDDGLCVPGSSPCPTSYCDESADVCRDCLTDTHCDDGSFCSGAEFCVDFACTQLPDPCPGQMCNEAQNVCAECLTDTECGDGVFCNGIESCSAGACVPPPTESCPGRVCDEAGEACIGPVELQPRAGMPLLRLSEAEVARFDAGRLAFNRAFTPADGLGPIFNEVSCGTCHNSPNGGSGTITVTRFGFSDPKLGGFDPLENVGGSLLQLQAIAPECVETVPPQANVVSNRVTNSILGMGLVESVAEADLTAAATSPPPGVSGQVHWVEALEDPGNPRMGRFGWKAQVPTLLTFAADAALNEIGITNRFLPTENAPNGDPGLLAQCDTVADPEDGPDGEGFDFIDRVTDFQRFLAPPPQTPRSGMIGELHFILIGCANCHTPLHTTADDAALEPALRDKVLHPYSDFLLHDMGAHADFIEQDAAGEREMRTTPLWGLRLRDPLWHDGRVAGGTFADRVVGAVDLHRGLDSEAAAAGQAFDDLPQAIKDAVVRFLDSLGRAEFDMDGDNDVDQLDYFSFEGCRTGPGSFFDAEDACAVADVDQDGDVDDDDFAGFLGAAEGAAGAAPDGFNLPGVPLTLAKAAAGEVTLSWGDSCSADDLAFAVYEGPLGDFADQTAVDCAVAGTSTTFLPAAGSSYYLVTPHNGFREGGLGLDSAGLPRAPGAGHCMPQATGACQ